MSEMSVTNEQKQSLVSSRGVFVYDLETLKSLFSAVFYDIDTKETFIFKIYEYTNDIEGTVSVNDIVPFIDFALKCKGLIGYNNFKFDYPILDDLIKNQRGGKFIKWSPARLTQYIHQLAQQLISLKYPPIKAEKMLIKQLDIFKMRHYDSYAKSASLKQLQAALRYHNVQEMKFSHDYIIQSAEDVKHILDYNVNDVLSTNAVYEKCIDDVLLRKQLASIYKLENIHTDSEPRLSREIFAKLLSDEMKIPIEELKKMRTNRETVIVKDILLDYLHFEDANLKLLLEFYKLQEIKQLKGFFKDIPSTNPGFKILKKIVPAEYFKKSRKKVNGKMVNVEICECIAIKYKGTTHVFGNGGIHSLIKGLVVESTSTKIIRDFDVASYYPNLSIENGFKPEHLGESFMALYKRLYIERSNYPKKTAQNTIIKLLLNSAYGMSNNEHSFLYDKKMTASICINGQLLIMMLVEQMTKIEGVHCFMTNTDGATFLCDRDKHEEVSEVSRKWQALTRLKLEEANYQKMYFRDVNSYIWIPENFDKDNFDYMNKKHQSEKVKLKGYFELSKELHKNHSSMIIPQALIAYYAKGIPIEQTVKSNKDIYDFCKIVKAKGDTFYETKSWNEFGFEEYNKEGKIVRYFVTQRNRQIHKNVVLLKKMPPLKTETKTEIYKKQINKNQTDIFDFVDDVKVIPRRESEVESGKCVTIFNRFFEKPFNSYRINYKYYIKKCQKVISQIEGVIDEKRNVDNNVYYELF